MGLAHHPRGPSQGDKKGRVSIAPEAQHPAHPTQALSGPLGVTLLPSSASRARACLRPGGGACPSPHPGSGGGGGATNQVCLGPPLGGRTLDPTGGGALAERAEGSAEGLGQEGTQGSP